MVSCNAEVLLTVQSAEQQSNLDPKPDPGVPQLRRRQSFNHFGNDRLGAPVSPEPRWAPPDRPPRPALPAHPTVAAVKQVTHRAVAVQPSGPLPMQSTVEAGTVQQSLNSSVVQTDQRSRSIQDRPAAKSSAGGSSTATVADGPTKAPADPRTVPKPDVRVGLIHRQRPIRTGKPPAMSEAASSKAHADTLPPAWMSGAVAVASVRAQQHGLGSEAEMVTAEKSAASLACDSPIMMQQPPVLPVQTVVRNSLHDSSAAHRIGRQHKGSHVQTHSHELPHVDQSQKASQASTSTASTAKPTGQAASTRGSTAGRGQGNTVRAFPAVSPIKPAAVRLQRKAGLHAHNKRAVSSDSESD